MCYVHNTLRVIRLQRTNEVLHGGDKGGGDILGTDIDSVLE